jgi:dTDP-4-dehydrorhamnose 3,5-epimerase
MVGEFYSPGMEGGLLYDDPVLGLEWPLPVEVISGKDKNWKPLQEIEPILRQQMKLTSPTAESTVLGRTI